MAGRLEKRGGPPLRHVKGERSMLMLAQVNLAILVTGRVAAKGGVGRMFDFGPLFNCLFIHLFIAY